MRRAPAVVLFAILLCSQSMVTAQTHQSMGMTVPSPTAASLGRFGDIPVDLNPGLPEISIPLFVVKGTTLQLPITLRYHASGIKVEEIGGWVGMGWVLEAGGVITRTVRGIPDERAEGYFNKGHAFYVSSNWTDPPPNTLLYNIHDELIDGEPDQFFFNFAGQVGQIVGGPTTSNINDPNVYVTAPYRKWRIQPGLGPNIQSWVITTEDGTRYTFGAVEMHTDRTEEYGGGTGGRDYTPYAASWYLTEIRSVGGDVITLTYDNYSAEHHLGMYREKFSDRAFCGTPGTPENTEEGSATIYDLHTLSVIAGKVLASITSAQHSVSFANSTRQDAKSPSAVAQERRLDLITIKTPTPENATLRKFEFEYSYTGPLGGRLSLNNVYEEDAAGNRLPPYSFTYYGPTLPPRPTTKQEYHPGTGLFALDHWGYFNGRTNNTSSIPPGISPYGQFHRYGGADRKPDSNFTRAGSLDSIKYPTGGFNKFIYSVNDYSTIWSGALLTEFGAGRLESVGSHSMEGPNDREFVVGGIEAVYSKVTTNFSEGCGPQPCPYVKIVKVTGQVETDVWGPRSNATLPLTYVQDGVMLEPGTYRLRASAEFHPMGTAGATINISFQERFIVPRKLGAGLRIAEVRAGDQMGPNGGNVTIRKYRYLQDDLSKSSGVIGVEPRYGYGYTETDPNGNLLCAWFSRSSASRIPLGAGPIISYSHATDSLGASGEFGSSRSVFEPGGDAPTSDDWPYLRFTTNAWRRGQELTVRNYDAQQRTRRFTQSTFEFPTWPQTTRTFRGISVDVWSGGAGTALLFNHNRFVVESGLKLKVGELTQVYDETGTNAVSTEKLFVHGNPDHAQLTRIAETNSDGTQRITDLRYPADYGTGGPPGTEAGALVAMQDVSANGVHMPGVVVQRSVSVKTPTSYRVVQAEITTFKEFATGKFLPYKRYALNSPSPVQ